MKVKIINKTEFELPNYATTGSAGMDLRANLKNEANEVYDIILQPNEQYIIPTGIFIQLPPPMFESTCRQGWGYEAQIRPRSGLAAKHKLTITNAPGTIDSDYIDEIRVILMNLSDVAYTIKYGDRIAQMVINRYEIIEWEETDTLEETDRKGGFGHTGY
jgi:dUTP pyrophosphatase